MKIEKKGKIIFYIKMNENKQCYCEMETQNINGLMVLSSIRSTAAFLKSWFADRTAANLLVTTLFECFEDDIVIEALEKVIKERK